MTFEAITAFLMGLGLAATAGFRVFVPLLIGALAIRGEMVVPAEGFLWLGSDAALILFSVATVLEVLAFYVPWVDNLLDTVATPAAIVAGTLLTASFIGESSEIFRWSVAIIAGGGAAGIVQGITVLVRGGSTTTTGGVANPLVATGELGASVAGGVFTIFFPVIAVIIMGVVLLIIFSKIRKKRRLKAA